jgi:hypothetical protein
MADTEKPKNSRVSLTFGRELSDADLAKLKTDTSALTIIRNFGGHHHHEDVEGGDPGGPIRTQF